MFFLAHVEHNVDSLFRLDNLFISLFFVDQIMSKFSAVRVVIPDDLESFLYGLSREVLRDQPVNIYAYAAKYSRNILALRQGKSPIDTHPVCLASSQALVRMTHVACRRAPNKDRRGAQSGETHRYR